MSTYVLAKMQTKRTQYAIRLADETHIVSTSLVWIRLLLKGKVDLWRKVKTSRCVIVAIFDALIMKAVDVVRDTATTP